MVSYYIQVISNCGFLLALFEIIFSKDVLIRLFLIFHQFCCSAVLGRGNKIDRQIKKGELKTICKHNYVEFFYRNCQSHKHIFITW